MKKILVGFLALSLVAVTSCKKNEAMDDTQIPEPIKTYVRTNFNGNEITECKVEKEGFSRFYDVQLTSNSVSLRFTETPEIQEIHSSTELPETVIDPAIDKYVDNNYAPSVITDWILDTKKKMQTVRLNNGKRLEFNSSGDFQREL